MSEIETLIMLLVGLNFGGLLFIAWKIAVNDMKFRRCTREMENGHKLLREGFAECRKRLDNEVKTEFHK